MKKVQHYKNIVINNGDVCIDGETMPPCPGKGHNSTVINNKVYLNGYELVGGKWKRTLAALWHKWL